jgi:septal ring factor EnvC (AmiA/AmiB activator)
MTRAELKSKISEKKEEYREIERTLKDKEDEIRGLLIEDVLLSDDIQWFEEKTEKMTKRENRKKVEVDALVGRVYWKESFKDGYTGDSIEIQRCRVVRVNGEWV